MPTNQAPHGRAHARARAIPSPPSAYAHHRSFPRSSSIHELPYLGGPEDRIKAAFLSSYQGLANLFRMPVISSNILALYHDDPLRIPGYIQALLDQAAYSMTGSVVTDLTTAVATGAAAARLDLFAPLRKAEPAYALPALTPTRDFTVPRWPSSLRIPLAAFGRTRGHAPLDHIAAARALTADMVVRINQAQRDEIVQLIVESMTQAHDVDLVGLQIAQIVGLFPRWQRAVQNLRRNMDRSGVRPDIAERRAAEYSDELREKRGSMIARTELMRALNQGREDSWWGLVQQGQVDPTRSVKEWKATWNACEHCEDMGDWNASGHGMRIVGIDALFPTYFGPISMPPMHPHCRCTVKLHPAWTQLSFDPSQYYADESVVTNPEMARVLAASTST